MRDRTTGIILTVIIAVLLACPGLAFLCFGLTDFLAFYGGNNLFSMDPGWAHALGFLGLCIGFFLIVITVVAGFLLLRRRNETPASMFYQPIPPTQPDQPIPPTQPNQPIPPTPPDEPLPPSI